MLAFEEDGDWAQKDNTIAALENLTRDDLRAMLQGLTVNDGLQFTTLSMAEQHAEALDSVKQTFSDILIWKRQQQYR